jgi:hypothetical protein
LGVLKYKTGDITYAQRGRSDKEIQAGIQHFDDPVLRLLCFKDLALKKNLHLYSWEDGFISTGLKGNPPKILVFTERWKKEALAAGATYAGAKSLSAASRRDGLILMKPLPLRKWLRRSIASPRSFILLGMQGGLVSLSPPSTSFRLDS